MRAVLLQLFGIFSIIWSYGQQPKALSLPLITTYTPAEYQGGIQNWAIDQDTLGYIYVANNYGLLEFDGATWNRYVIPESTKPDR